LVREKTQEIVAKAIDFKNLSICLKLYIPIANNFFFRPEKTELDYDTGIFMRLWNVKNVVSAVLSTIIQL
jgi:hypothetical protein